MSVQVAVIGGGAAGCMAALAAAARGAKVTLVHRSVGGTALSSGVVVLDGMEMTGVPLEDQMAAMNTLGRVGSLRGSLGGEPRTWMSSTGSIVGSNLVAMNHEAGSMESLAGKQVAVVGIQGLVSHDPASLSRRLRSVGVQAQTVWVKMEGLHRKFDLQPFAVAKVLDDTQMAQALIAAIAKALAGRTVQAIGLPAVMGYDAWKDVRKAMDEALGSGRWFEFVSVPPSVPGMRLHRALHAELGVAGVEVIHGNVVRTTFRGKIVTGLLVKDGQTQRELNADEVVLATGKHVGGGIAMVDRPAEATMSLPVYERRGGDGGEDSWLEAGVLVDGDMRPVGRGDEVVALNVRVAGAVLAGSSYGLGTGGIGFAAVTGWRAGSLAGGAKASARIPDVPSRTVEATMRAGVEGCIGCEACSSICPVLGVSTVEGPWYPGPRGMGGLGRSGPLLEAAGDPLSLCTLCGACASICPVGARNHETVAAMRATLIERKPDGVPEAWRVLPQMLAAHPSVFGPGVEPVKGPRRSDARIAFFPGCSGVYFERESVERTVKLLEAMGIPFSVVDGACCGGPLDVLGLPAPEESVRHNREAVAATGASIVTAACPRCAHRLAQDLQMPGVTVEHTLETLERELPGSAVLERLRAKLDGKTVTYHDPCEIGRYKGMYEGARRVLGMVGAKVIEMPRTRDESVCCGAGGGLRSANARLSREISRQRVTEAVGTGAEVLATECPSCMHNLRTGRKRKQKIEVENVTAILGQALDG